ncbi:MAG TPA: alpha/beta fold hydrolase [Gemmatimonadales bacterium]|nr:alpha/beta fold hydrolase [Gemmatimonadales bacterium]
MRQFAIAALVVAAVVWIGVAALLKASERSLIYVPGDREVPEPHPSFALRHRSIEFLTADSVLLHAWIIPAAPAASAPPADFWLLIAHGNYGSIGFGERPEFYAAARDIGLNLLAFDYRGFGRSGGRPGEEGLYRDAEAAYRYLTDSLQVPPRRIVLFGHSLGTGVATELATRVPSAALVLEAAYTSIPDIGQAAYPWLPVKLLAGERFETIDRIGRVTVPKLLLHSPEDEIVPYEHGRRVYEAASGEKRFVTVRGGHAGAFSEDRETYFGAISELLKSLR